MPGKVIVYKAIQDDGTSYWPNTFPADKLKDWQTEMGPVSFSSQYQSSPMDTSGNYLKRSWLSWYDWNKRPEYFEKVVTFIDPAASQKNSADFFAMCTAGLFENRIYLLSMIRTRAPLETQLSLVKDIYAVWAPDIIVIEAGGPQLYFLNYIKSETLFNIQEPDKNWHRSDKKIKFESAAAHFNAGRALLPGYKDDLDRWQPIDEFSIFVEEWVSFPDAPHDDTLDAVAGALTSIISTVTAAGVTEPDNPADTRKFVEDVVKLNQDRGLTKEEQEILDNYFNDDGVGSIRKDGSGLRMMTHGSGEDPLRRFNLN